MKKVMKGIFSKLIFNILKNYINSIVIYDLFLPERMKIEKVKKLVTNLHDKSEYVIHIRNLKQGLCKIFIKFRGIFDPRKIIYWKLLRHCPTI